MSIKPFLSNVSECVSTRESKEHVEELNSKVKLQLYKSFGTEVDFKTYLHGVSDAGTRLLFKALGLHEEELLDDINKGQCPASLFCRM